MRTILDTYFNADTIPLSPAQLAQLAAFGTQLLEKNQVMNLTAITEPSAVAQLHFFDCISLTRAVDFSNQRVIDVGCGAGFPGVPLKIAVPSMELTLLDSLNKRIRWLQDEAVERRNWYRRVESSMTLQPRAPWPGSMCCVSCVCPM